MPFLEIDFKKEVEILQKIVLKKNKVE